MSNSIAHVVLSSLGVSTATLVFGGVTLLSVCISITLSNAI